MVRQSFFLSVICIVLAVAVLMPPSPAAAAPFAATCAANSGLADLVERVAPGVVNISSNRFVKQYVLRGMPEYFGFFGIPEEHVQKQSSLGSGFLIDTSGYILTNFHVVEDADEVLIQFADKRRLPAKIVGRDKALDLALLQLKGGRTVPNLNPVPMGTNASLRVGDSVFAIGNPFGLQHSVSHGIISAKNRTIGAGPYDNFLQTDTNINFGNSGGPLFNAKGEVIGINTAIRAQAQGIGFAIPIDEAKQQLDSLKRFGYVVRPWLGILGVTISAAMAYSYDLPVDHGVLIERLDRSGPGAKSDFRAGDIITSLNGTPVQDRTDIQRMLATLKPGDGVRIEIHRRRQVLSKNVKLVAAPDVTEFPEGVL